MSININIQININNLGIRPLNRQVTTDKIFSHLAHQYCERISEKNIHISFPSPLTRQTNYEITFFQECIPFKDTVLESPQEEENIDFIDSLPFSEQHILDMEMIHYFLSNQTEIKPEKRKQLQSLLKTYKL